MYTTCLTKYIFQNPIPILWLVLAHKNILTSTEGTLASNATYMLLIKLLEHGMALANKTKFISVSVELDDFFDFQFLITEI
jgi:hypothetical protein